MKDIIAQSFGIVGLVIIVSSFQCKKNKNFFLLQGLGSLFFVVNFLLISAYTGAFFNLTNLVRGLMFSKTDKKVSVVLYISLVVMSVLMWLNDGKYIRYFQVAAQSPIWIVYNIFNFTLGGILCESFNMISTIVSFIRYGKEGFEK